jgi:hypothetical protein
MDILLESLVFLLLLLLTATLAELKTSENMQTSEGLEKDNTA